MCVCVYNNNNRNRNLNNMIIIIINLTKNTIDILIYKHSIIVYSLVEKRNFFLSQASTHGVRTDIHTHTHTQQVILRNPKFSLIIEFTDLNLVRVMS